jgi:hypothetical protein
MSHPLIGQVLTQMGKLSSIDIDEILVEQNASRRRFGEIAVSWGLCDIQELCDAWCSQAGQALAVNIDVIGIDPAAVHWVPSSAAHAFGVIPLRAIGDQVICAAARILDSVEMAELVRAVGRDVRLLPADAVQVAAALRRHYPRPIEIAA